MAKNLYGYGLDYENLYGRNTIDYTGYNTMLLRDSTSLFLLICDIMLCFKYRAINAVAPGSLYSRGQH
jgi:hypothetical protein